MKRLTQLSHSLLFLFVICGITSAQTSGDYRTHQTGNWNDVNTWEKYNGATWDYPAAETPDSNSVGASSILSGDTVTVTATVGVHNVTVDSGGYVIVNGSPVVLYIASGGMTVKGTLIVAGITNTAVPYSVTNTTGTLTIGNGGILQYSQTHGTASQKGALPTATWQNGSTCIVTSVGGTGATGFNSGGAQNFYNLIWNCTTQTANFGIGFTNHIINGNVDVISTGTGRLQLFGGASGTLQINGDFTMYGGTFTAQGSGSQTFDTLYFNGKVKALGGTNFSLSRGSQSGGTGTTIWYVNGDSMIVNGASTITMQNSNYGLGNTKIYFSKKGSQVVKLNNVAISGYTAATSGSGFPFEVLDSSTTKFLLSNITYSGSGASIVGQVDSGGTLNLDTSKIAGIGNFTLKNGGTIITTHANGINGNLTGPDSIKSLSKKANYAFNGSVAQVPGSLLPDSVNALWVSNPAGLTLSDTLYCNWLKVASGALLRVDTIGVLVADMGAVNGTIWNSDSVSTSKGFVFGNGAIYEHARNGGAIPIGLWETGSTCLITGAVGNAPSNGNQNFYNLTWNCPGQTTGLNLGMTNSIIGGTLRVINSNSSAFRFTAGGVQLASGKKMITINGDIVVDSSTAYLTATGTGSPSDTFSVVVKGNIISRGNFQLANGSGGMINWFVAGNVNAISGNFTTNSTATYPDSLIFNGTTTQTFTRGGDVTSSNIRFAVRSGTTVDFDTSTVGGSAASTFTLESDGTIITGHPLGLNGNLNNGGGTSLSSGANYKYNGAVPQVTGAMLPTTINGLTIENPSGVTLSMSTKVNSILSLINGKLAVGSNMLTVVQHYIAGSTEKYIVTNGTGKLKFAFVDTMESTMVEFPVGTVDSYAPVLIINFGVQDTFTVGVSSDTSNGSNRVKLKWDIAENTEGGTNAAIRFSWMPNVEGVALAANRSAFAKIYLLSSDTTEAGAGNYKINFDTPPYSVERDGFTNSGTYVIGKFGTTTSVGTENLTEVPIEYKLYQNYPNPFNPTTTIKFTVAKAGMARVKIYNAIGQEVATIFNQIAEPGKYYSVQLNASHLSSGMYFSVFESENHREIKKMLMLK